MSSSPAIQYPNTLRSDSFLRITELLSEGPIEGLATPDAPLQSVYFDQTPVQNANGTLNYLGITYDFRLGLNVQDALPGPSTAETTIAVETRVRATLPVIRTIVDENVTRLRVIGRIPALMQQDANGNVLPFGIVWFYDVRPAGGDWIEAVATVNLPGQKCTSPVDIVSEFELPGAGPWDVRFRRGTPDFSETSTWFSDESWWASYTEIVEARLSYPNSALAWIQVNAGQFGESSLPTRYYRLKGLKVQVPTTYDPVARTYTGVWDGTFKLAWTNNPTWIFRDLIVNDRYGLGQFIDADKVDKWGLYQISQYCDQMVPDGFGGFEPRYTINTQIVSKQEAFKLLQSITSTWRGMGYWSLGQVFATADMPADPVKLVAPADVIDGHFKYSGTSLKTRHSVALVSWNDPEDFYRPAIEVVINKDQFEKFGWREVSITALGCTSRGSAHRFGKWALDTEQFATETVEYTASWDHADVKPGDIISVADPRKANARIGGRVAAIPSGSQVTIDGDFAPASGQSYTFNVEAPDGSIIEKPITGFSGRVLNLATIWGGSTPQIGAMWAITGTDVNPRQYRVIANRETEANHFNITAIFHDPTKYARVEQDIILAPIAYSRPVSTVKPPTNLNAVEALSFLNGIAVDRISLSWTPGDDFQSVAYSVSAQTPSGFVDFGTMRVPNLDIPNAEPGDYNFYVTALNSRNLASQPATLQFTAHGWAGVDGPYVSHLEITHGGPNNTFGGKDCRIDWQNNFPNSTNQVGAPSSSGASIPAGSGASNPLYRDNLIRIFDVDTGLILRTEVVTGTAYTYTYDNNTLDNQQFSRGPQRKFKIQVSIRDVLGRESMPATIVPNNPVPEMIIPTVVTGVGSIFCWYVLPTDLDFLGAMVWASQDETFDPLTTTPVYQGINNYISFDAEAFKTYYVRIAGYDQFGTTGLNISPPIEIVVNGQVIDRTPPAIPTGLHLTSSTETAETGEILPVLLATWDASPSDNFAYYDLQIKVAGGEFVSFQTNTNEYSWKNLIANTAYTVQVRAFSKQGFPSFFSDPVTVTMARKTTPPGPATSLSADASLKSVYLHWLNPTDPDVDHIEIWNNTSNNLGSATLIGKSYGTGFTHTGLTTSTTYYYWVRAVNTSDLAGNYSSVASATPLQAGTADLAANSVTANIIAANAITADKIVAGSITGDRLDISTSLPASITIGTTGVAIGAVTDPANLVNANSTQINPGRINIFGSTTLASWRNGGDNTKIEGGAIAANTITANKITIGNRNVNFTGLAFTYASNVLSWSTGTIAYTDDNGATQLVNIAAGNVTYAGSLIYIAWLKGASVFSVQTSGPFSDANYISLATYNGGSNLVANYGRTQIDANMITTGTIVASNLSATTLIVDQVQIGGGIITNTHLAGNITFDKMVGSTLVTTVAVKIGGDRFQLYAPNQQMTINDGIRNRVMIGGDGAGNYGMWLWDSSGNLILSSAGVNSVPLSAVNGQMTSANISTWIAAAAIGDAQVGTLSASKISASSLSAFTANLGTVTAGVARSSDSKFIIDFTNAQLSISDNT